MAVVTVERLDHLGLMAEVIKELGLISSMAWGLPIDPCP